MSYLPLSLRTFRRTMSLQREKQRTAPLQDVDFNDSRCKEEEGFADQLNLFSRSIGKDLGVKICVDGNGTSSFDFRGFVIVIEPSERYASFIVQTSLLKFSPNSTPIMRKALELNFESKGTSGSTLSMDPNCKGENQLELVLSTIAFPVQSMDPKIFRSILDDFVDTASDLHQKLKDVDESQSESRMANRKSIYEGSFQRLPQPVVPEGETLQDTFHDIPVDFGQTMERHCLERKALSLYKPSTSLQKTSPQDSTLKLRRLSSIRRSPASTTRGSHLPYRQRVSSVARKQSIATTNGVRKLRRQPSIGSSAPTSRTLAPSRRQRVGSVARKDSTSLDSLPKQTRISSFRPPSTTPPPPQDTDITPIISNSSARKGIHKDNSRDIPESALSVAKGRRVNMLKKKYERKDKEMPKKRSSVIRRLSRMVSKQEPRPELTRRDSSLAFRSQNLVYI